MGGESIVFCTASMGRNTYLQPATGLFGGDFLSIGTYRTQNAEYEGSIAYRATVASADAMYRRAPLSCWYAMGSAVVRSITAGSVPADPHTLRLAWNLTDGLWSSARIPGQCATLCARDVLIHATTCAGSTQKEAILASGTGGGG
jgi:hypothetical protein